MAEGDQRSVDRRIHYRVAGNFWPKLDGPSQKPGSLVHHKDDVPQLFDFNVKPIGLDLVESCSQQSPRRVDQAFGAIDDVETILDDDFEHAFSPRLQVKRAGETP
ncbi:hypothetical protein [Rhizobium sp. PEPV16]|uniref:hypothetical protein n=1 Tax=Rhizobium sp. PEPV16 TaxID=1820614 RepID=UPI0015E15CC6|nr:hypothetical protein [Rhizobium sp. PEPV16]KAF5881290.1 hypothetical protein FY112_30320 [Rhizobium sp. PEPV16]